MKKLELLIIPLLSTAIMQGSDFDRKPRLNDDLIMQLKDCPGVLATTVEEFEYANYLDVLSKDAYRDDFATQGKQIIIGINQLIHKQKTSLEQVADTEMLTQKQKRIENAQKLRAIRAIQRKQRRKVSIPRVETEKIITSLFHGIYPTTQEVKNLVMGQYLTSTPNKYITVTPVDPKCFDKKIYCVSVHNKPVFFLKISNNDSANRLITIQQSTIGRLGIESRYESRNSSIPQKNLPIIAWVEKIYTYTDKFNKDQTIQVIHAARGQMINTILETKSLEEQLICITATGKALGSFQQFFMDYNNSNEICKPWGFPCLQYFF